MFIRQEAIQAKRNAIEELKKFSGEIVAVVVSQTDRSEVGEVRYGG